MHSQHEGRTFGLRESALNLSLQEGLNAFNERMIPERLQDACTIFLNLHGSVDHESLQAEYDTTPEINRNAEVITRFGPLSSVMKNGVIFHRFQGVRFGKRTHSGFQGLPNGFPVDPQLISDTLHTMELHWKAAGIGKQAADFPVLTADLLESRVMAVDFGYDG